MAAPMMINIAQNMPKIREYLANNRISAAATSETIKVKLGALNESIVTLLQPS